MNSRFLVTAKDTATSDALWQIPIANPAGASKIGSIGSTGLTALAFENGQLTGISNKSDGTGTKIGINPTTGAIQLANGTILKPSDANYAAEAIRSAVIQAGKVDSKSGLDVPGGGIYAPVVVAQGSLADFVTKNPTNGGDGSAIHAYFNYLGANPDKFDHFKLTGPNTFAVEDQFGGGDRDFNDLTINMNFKTV